MPLSVTNGPSQFMNMMNDGLSDYLDDFVLVFLDDILVYSHIVEIHVQNLRKVLEVLHRHRLFGKASKCSIMEEEVEYIMPQRVAPLKLKMKTAME